MISSARRSSSDVGWRRGQVATIRRIRPSMYACSASRGSGTGPGAGGGLAGAGATAAAEAATSTGATARDAGFAGRCAGLTAGLAARFAAGLAAGAGVVAVRGAGFAAGFARGEVAGFVPVPGAGCAVFATGVAARFVDVAIRAPCAIQGNATTT
jgi:hypothetical protein